MQIIGKTQHGYIVEASGPELALAAGYNSVHEVPGAQRTGYDNYSYHLPLGTQIMPTETHKYLQQLRQSEEKVRNSESMLRALADMLRSALPTTVIPPEQSAPEDGAA